MKKLATLLLAAGMVFGACTGASAIDFKAKGLWHMYFDYGQNGDFARNGGTHQGYNNKQDDFEARQRIRLGLEAVASENLSGTVMFEINNTWGQGSAGSMGSDGINVAVKHAYLDWMVPQTDLKVRMGLQKIGLPSFTTDSQVFSADVAGIAASYQFNDNVGLTAFWARPYNDNYSGKSWGTKVHPKGEERNGSDRSNYLDNIDLFALTLPLTFDGVKVTPWAMLGIIGPNAVKADDEYRVDGPDDSKSVYRGGIKSSGPGGNNSHFFNGGMFPLGGAYAKTGAERNKAIHTYGTAFWAGATADITVFDPLRMAIDLNYGQVDWSNSRLFRGGWLASALVEYKLDWGVPGIVGWYASGDDDNPSNGSERMPTPGVDEHTNQFSDFAFNGAPGMVRDSVITGNNMAGTWGVGLRLKDVSFIEDLKHTLRVNYIGGTNSPKMLKRYMGYDADGNKPVYQYENIVGGSCYYDDNIGSQGLYMTTNDRALEFSLTNEYKMYENFKIYTQASYLLTSINNNRVYKGDNSRISVRDPWNINVSFMYDF